MQVRPTIVIGLGAFGAHLLNTLKVRLDATYSQSIDPIHWMPILYHANRDLPYLKEVSNIPPIIIKDDLKNWWALNDNNSIGRNWLQENLSRRIQAERIPKHRQLLRLALLQHLSTSDYLKIQMERAVQHVQDYSSSTVELHIVGILADNEMRAWYFDIANLVRYSFIQAGLECELMLHLAFADSTDDIADLSEQRRLDTESFAFLLELEHFNSQDVNVVTGLYPNSMGQLKQLNSYRKMSDMIFVYPTEELSTYAKKSNFITAQIINNMSALLDDNGGARFAEFNLTNRDATRIANPSKNRSQTNHVRLVRSNHLILPLHEMYLYWTNHIELDALASIQNQQIDIAQITADILNGALVPHFTKKQDVSIPTVIQHLYQKLAYQGTTTQIATNIKEEKPLAFLAQILTDTLSDDSFLTKHLQVINATEKYPHPQSATLYINDVTATYNQLFISKNDLPTAYEHWLEQQFYTIKQAQTSTLISITDWVHQQATLTDTMNVITKISVVLDDLQEVCQYLQSRSTSPEQYIKTLALQGETIGTLYKSNFFRADTLTQSAKTFITQANQAFSRACLHYHLAFTQDLITHMQGILSQIIKGLETSNALMWHGRTAFARRIKQEPFNKPIGSLPINTEWLQQYYQQNLQHLSSRLANIVTRQWQIVPNGDIRLHYEIDKNRIVTPEQAHAHWTQNAQNLVTLHVQNMTIWSVWRQSNHLISREQVLQQLTTLPEFINYNQTINQSVVQNAHLVISSPITENNQFVTIKHYFEQHLPPDYPLKTIETNASTDFIYLQYTSLPIKNLIQYEDMKKCYENKKLKRASYHILAGEVQASLLSSDTILPPQIRVFLNQPEQCDLFLQLIVLGMIEQNQFGQLVIHDEQNNQDIFLTSTKQDGNYTQALSTLTRLPRTSQDMQNINKLVNEVKKRTISQMKLGEGKEELKRTHQQLWQYYNDLMLNISSPPSITYNESAIWGQLIYTAMEANQHLASDTTPVDNYQMQLDEQRIFENRKARPISSEMKQFLKLLAEKEINTIIEKLRRAL